MRRPRVEKSCRRRGRPEAGSLLERNPVDHQRLHHFLDHGREIDKLRTKGSALQRYRCGCALGILFARKLVVHKGFVQRRFCERVPSSQPIGAHIGTDGRGELSGDVGRAIQAVVALQRNRLIHHPLGGDDVVDHEPGRILSWTAST